MTDHLSEAKRALERRNETFVKLEERQERSLFALASAVVALADRLDGMSYTSAADSELRDVGQEILQWVDSAGMVCKNDSPICRLRQLVK
jgi:hypothetical protein